MLYRRTVLTVVMGMCLIASSVARGDEVEDLRAANEQYLAALNNQDLDALMAFFHDQVVWFGPNAPFPSEGKATYRRGFQMLFSTHESITVRPMNPQYRVIGSSGVVIRNGMAAFKPNDGPLQTFFLRVLQNWVKVDGKWLLVASHTSYIPPGN